ncbi:MAG: guanylate kinase [Bacilli bacterium]|nr:guanylate kinase [Bacilli bacterium]
MKLNQNGLLIVLSGPSGVGKGTVRKALFESEGHNFTYSISMTTRSPRVGEVEGSDYYFVSKEEFEQRIKDGKFLEYAEFVGNYYGTPIDKVEQNIEEGREVVLEIEVEGARQVKQKKPDAVFIFIAPPSFEALHDRLRRRGTEKAEVIKERLDKARRELMLINDYDYIVINDDVNNAADRIRAIIRAEHARTKRSAEGYIELLEESNHDNTK